MRPTTTNRMAAVVKSFLPLCSLVFFTLTLSAARVKSEWRLYTQPDGTTLSLLLCGDEHFGCYRATDGRLLTRDSLGFFRDLTTQGVSSHPHKAPRRLPPVNTRWDSRRTYRQLVILLSFSDTDFRMAKPRETHDSLFNVPGYNRLNGPGCVADYFRDQSGGLFNLAFDVFGPYQVSTRARSVENANESTRNLGEEQMQEATRKMIADNPTLDFSVYDWDDNGNVNQVVYVYAGYCGNQTDTISYGHIWPNTSSFSPITTPDGFIIDYYSISGELWANKASCGLGTICHEFSHTLGLPDIYPTNGKDYSAVDEWDLMDGGNFTNYGWCPPNYTALEKMLLGWLTPREMTRPTDVNGLKPVSEGGDAYVIRHTDSEYLLLENRQWQGWDSGLPGRGLVVYHVNYNGALWEANRVNASSSKYNFELIPADNLSYQQWDDIMAARGWANTVKVYRNQPRMNSFYMSSAAYPWTTDSTQTVNDELSDTTTPATVMHNENEAGLKLLSKPISDIGMTAEGLVSFRFLGDMGRQVRIAFSPFGQATFYSSSNAFRLPAGLTASVVTGITNGKLLYTPIAGAVIGTDLIPKATAVYLTVDRGSDISSCLLTATDDDYTYEGPNLLMGSDTETTTTSLGQGDCLFYKLTYGNTPDGGDAFGWFWGEAHGGPFTVGAHKAWLAVPRTQATRSHLSAYPAVSPRPAPLPDVCHDLQGRLSRPRTKGLYISNGKKTMIRP